MSVPRLLRLSDRLKEMRACDEGMGLHCIDLLVQEVQPLVAALLADYGKCQTHDYVETSHWYAVYSGQPLVVQYNTTAASSGGG